MYSNHELSKLCNRETEGESDRDRGQVIRVSHRLEISECGNKIVHSYVCTHPSLRLYKSCSGPRIYIYLSHATNAQDSY